MVRLVRAADDPHSIEDGEIGGKRVRGIGIDTVRREGDENRRFVVGGAAILIGMGEH